MKRFVHNVVLFVLLATAAVAAGVVALGGTGRLRNVVYHLGTGDCTHTRIAEIGAVHDVDILFVGSSHAYRTFDPRYYAEKGLRTFNLGSSNQTPIQTEMLLRQYLDTLRPKIVVMEVHPDMVAGDGVESTIGLANNMKPSAELMRTALKTRNVKAILSVFYSGVRNGCGRAIDTYEELRSNDENEYIAGGYVARRGGRYVPEPIVPETIEMNPDQLEATGRIAGMLGSRGTPFLMVKVPDSRAMSSSYIGIDRFDASMEAIGAYSRIEIDDLVDSVHFYDPTHLNQAGVDLFEEIFYDTVLEPFINQHKR